MSCIFGSYIKSRLKEVQGKKQRDQLGGPEVMYREINGGRNPGGSSGGSEKQTSSGNIFEGRANGLDVNYEKGEQ